MAVFFREKLNNSAHLIYKIHYYSRYMFVFLLITNSALLLKAQNIIDKIDNTSRSSINAYSLNSKKVPIDTTRGFFISADGLAITRASLFEKSDSVIFTDEKNKPLLLNKIIAFHSFGNLALIQLKNPRTKDIDYIQPSNQPFISQGEIMAFTNSFDAEKGLGYGEIKTVLRIPFLGRCAIINLKAGGASEGSPIIDGSGNFIGIYHFTGSARNAILIPATVITDDDWISVNQNWAAFKKNTQRIKLSTPLYARALIYQAQGEWIEAARTYTSLLKANPDNALVHALRSLVRFNYGNNIGGSEDFTFSLNLDPNGYYPYFSRAIHYLNTKERYKALEDLFQAVDKNSDFSDAFLEIGRTQVIIGDIKRAFASFSYAIKTDSLLAEAWYERGRLYVQHSTDQEKALEDLTKAAKLNPSLNGIYTLIGNIKFSRQDYLEAILDFDKAINQNGKDAHALMNRGMAYYNTGIKGKACADWEKAGKLGHLQAFKLISRHCTDLHKGTFSKNY